MTHRLETLFFGASGPVGRAAVEEMSARGVRVATAGRSASDFTLDVSAHDQVLEFFDTHNAPRIVYLVRPDLGVGGSEAIDHAVRAFSLFVSAAAERGLERLAFASSAAVYGDRWAAPVRESDTLAGESAYAVFKRESERVLADNAQRYGFGFASLRIFNVYGPGCHSSLINKLTAGPPPDLVVTTAFVRDYIHSSDVARALYQATISDSVCGPINVGTGTPVDNLRLAELVGPGAFRSVAPGGQSSYSVADISTASSKLDFHARVDLAEYLGHSS